MLTDLWNSYSAWTANTLGISGAGNLILARADCGGHRFHVQEDVPCSSVYHCICNVILAILLRIHCETGGEMEEYKDYFERLPEDRR